MPERTRPALALSALTLGCAVALSTTVLVTASVRLGPGTAHATTTQFGCTFTPPKPTISSGKTNFTVKASCATSRDRRKVSVELVADDKSYDDTLRAASTSVPAGRGSYSIAGSRWVCQEDNPGADEIYLRVRIEAYQNGSWRKSAWKNGSAAVGDCH